MDYTYAALFNNNGHTHGFENKLAVSNKAPGEYNLKGKAQICFLNYDLKNAIETFKLKNNNPLQFPQQCFIEIEKEVTLSEFTFDTVKKIPFIKLEPVVTKTEYLKNIQFLKSQIQAGNIYEINYCITFEAFNVEIDPVSVYQQLNAISLAPYSCLLKLKNLYIISSSPELYISKNGNTVVSKPIKGTARRSNKPAEDNEIKTQLQQNLKEQNENVMIVDVVRNDLSKIAERGSVTVSKLFDIESYRQVHQMVSTVQCHIKNTITHEELIKATFPMASMTGAPKYKAMQLIDEIEYYNRSAYSGSAGYIKANGDADLNVLIRSIFYDSEKKYLSFSVGSAITDMCNPEQEYEECLLKAQAMIEVLK